MKETGDKFHSYCFLTYYQEENTTIRRLAFELSCRRHEKKKKKAYTTRVDKFTHQREENNGWLFS